MAIPVTRSTTIAGVPTHSRTALVAAAQPLPGWCLEKLDANTQRLTAEARVALNTPVPLEQAGRPRRLTAALVQLAPANAGILYLHGIACAWAGALPEAEAAFVRSTQHAQTLAAQHPELKWGFPDSNLMLAMLAGLDGDGAAFVARLSAVGASLSVHTDARQVASVLERYLAGLPGAVTEPVSQQAVFRDFATRLRTRPSSVARPLDDFDAVSPRLVLKGQEESEPEYWFRVHHNLLMGAGESLPSARVGDAVGMALDLLFLARDEETPEGAPLPALLDRTRGELEAWGTALVNLVADSPIDVSRWLGDDAPSPEQFNDRSLAEAAALLGVPLRTRLDPSEHALLESVREGRDRRPETLQRVKLIVRATLAEQTGGLASPSRLDGLADFITSVTLDRPKSG